MHGYLQGRKRKAEMEDVQGKTGAPKAAEAGLDGEEGSKGGISPENAKEVPEGVAAVEG